MPAIAPENSVQCETRAEWRAWLAENHERDKGVWLVTFKKASSRQSVGYDASVEEAVCYGWIDNRSNSLDDERSMLWFAPRRKGSNWSKSNKDRVAKADESRIDDAAGIAKVEAAKRDAHGLHSMPSNVLKSRQTWLTPSQTTPVQPKTSRHSRDGSNEPH